MLRTNSRASTSARANVTKCVPRLFYNVPAEKMVPDYHAGVEFLYIMDGSLKSPLVPRHTSYQREMPSTSIPSKSMRIGAVAPNIAQPS